MNWRKTEEQNIFTGKGSHVSFRAGKFRIRCISGIIWITWPGSGDVILRGGEHISVSTHGTLSLTAFSDSFIYIEKIKLTPKIRDIPYLVIRKVFSAVLSYIKNGEHHSVFGDSIHSFIR